MLFKLSTCYCSKELSDVIETIYIQWLKLKATDEDVVLDEVGVVVTGKI